MTRAPSLFRALLLLAPLLGGLAACGNKGPLFLPPPAVQQPEPASPSGAAAPAANAESAPAESAPAESADTPATGD